MPRPSQIVPSALLHCSLPSSKPKYWNICKFADYLLVSKWRHLKISNNPVSHVYQERSLWEKQNSAMLELSVPERCVTQFSFSGLACHRTCAVTCASTPEGSCFETVTVPWSELAMTRTSTCIYHFFVLSWYIFLNFYISQQGEDRRKSKVFLSGGQWKYLTFLNLVSPFGCIRKQAVCL